MLQVLEGSETPQHKTERMGTSQIIMEGLL